MNEQKTTTQVTVVDQSELSEKERVIREEDFNRYVLWKALPAAFKKPPRDRKTGIAMESKDFLELMGVTDQAIFDLCEIKNQSQFAEKYSISPDTLTNWNKKIAERDPMADIRLWAVPLTKNVINALYNRAIQKGMSYEVELFMEIVNKWSKKQVVEHDYKGVKSITYEVIEPKHAIPADGDQKADQPEAGASA